jgi:hypothetical protein
MEAAALVKTPGWCPHAPGFDAPDVASVKLWVRKPLGRRSPWSSTYPRQKSEKVKLMRARGASEVYDVRLPVCYATETLADAAAMCAQRRMMSVSQFIRVALLEAISRDGVELKNAEQRR